MNIAILGAGPLAQALAHLFKCAQHTPYFCFSRDKTKLEHLNTQFDVPVTDMDAALAAADLIVLAVHWDAMSSLIPSLPDLNGKILINCVIPLDSTSENLVMGPQQSGAQWLAQQLPSARIVCTFNTSPSETVMAMAQLSEPLAQKPQLLIYADDIEAKTTVSQWIEDLGYQPVDTGTLKSARFVEPFAMVTAELAYEQSQNPQLVYQFSYLPQPTKDS